MPPFYYPTPWVGAGRAERRDFTYDVSSLENIALLRIKRPEGAILRAFFIFLKLCFGHPFEMGRLQRVLGFVTGMGLAMAPVGCGHTPWAVSQAPRAVEISIAKTSPSAWRVRYELTEPLSILYFEQQLHRFRVGRWKTIDSGTVLEEFGGKEAIRRRDGKEFRSVELEFGAESPAVYDYYAFSLPFGDGSHAFYSGHFLLHGDWRTTFRFIPYAGERTDVVGADDPGAKIWASPSNLEDYGAFVYFGNIPRTSGRYFDLLVDPALPKELRFRLTETLPKILSTLETETGFPIRRRLTILVSRWPNAIDRHRFMATASDRWISVDLQGADWGKKSPEADAKFFGLLAHELSHLYTAQIRKDFLRVAWMNEGGADFFANTLARRFSIITDAQSLARLRQSFEACQRFRAARRAKLSDPDSRVDAGYYYQCGMIVHAILERLLARAATPRTFFQFWGTLLREADASGGIYSEREYFALARRWAPSDDLDFLEGFVNGTTNRAAAESARLRQMLNAK